MVVRVVVLALVVAGVAEGAVLCAKPKHDGAFDSAVNIREACKPGEVQLDPAALGLQGPPGPPGQPGEPGVCTCPGRCEGSGVSCSSDADCAAGAGVCDNNFATATCVQTCSTNGDCNPGMFCFPSGQLGVGVCAGCGGNDAACPGQSVCKDSLGGLGDNCGIHHFAGCLGQPTLTPCNLPGRCVF